MQFSDEELIAYLLGDASSALARRLQQQLPDDSELLERLTQFRILLGQIDSLGATFEPPADLVDGTFARIDDLEGNSQAMQASVGKLESQSRPSGIGQSSGVQPVLLGSRSDLSPRKSSLWDSTALTISLTILCCLALPTLVRVRFESRKAQCARNLSITGSELIQFAMNHPDGRFPRVALEGPESFAGVYAIYLHDAGAELTPEQLQCASLIGARRGSQASPISSSSTISARFAGAIPSIVELHQMAVAELSQWQRTLGGDYAYNLGVAEQGSIRAPKCEGRSQFAILADAPLIAPMPDSNSLSAEVVEKFIAHEGKGINILFEDGRVVFITAASLMRPAIRAMDAGDTRTADGSLTGFGLADNPLQNQRGVHEVGLHPHDASLAPSHFSPLGN